MLLKIEPDQSKCNTQPAFKEICDFNFNFTALINEYYININLICSTFNTTFSI